MSDVTVRPRLVWAGVFAAIVGMVLAGLGLVISVPVLWIVGAVLIVGGLAFSWRNGIMYDIHDHAPVEQAEENLVKGQAFEGHAPEDTIGTAKTREVAVVATRDALTARLEAATRVEPLPLRRTAATILLGLSAWLYLSQFILEFPMTWAGQNAGLRVTAFAAVLAVCAIFLRQVGPSRVVGGIALLCGILLIVFGITFAHDTTAGMWDELLSGLAVSVVAVATWV